MSQILLQHSWLFLAMCPSPPYRASEVGRVCPHPWVAGGGRKGQFCLTDEITQSAGLLLMSQVLSSLFVTSCPPQPSLDKTRLDLGQL